VVNKFVVVPKTVPQAKVCVVVTDYQNAFFAGRRAFHPFSNHFLSNPHNIESNRNEWFAFKRGWESMKRDIDIGFDSMAMVNDNEY
jgi:hypothetical protein